MISAQDREVGAGHAEEAAVAQRLHGAVEEDAAGAVRVQVDHIEAMRWRAVGVHEHRGVTREGEETDGTLGSLRYDPR